MKTIQNGTSTALFDTLKPIRMIGTGIAIAGVSTVSLVSAQSDYPTVIPAQQSIVQEQEIDADMIKDKAKTVRDSIVSLVQKGLSSLPSPEDIQEQQREPKKRIYVDVYEEKHNDTAGVDPFNDIALHPNKFFIGVLAAYDIVDGQRDKFYPDNYIRLVELTKMAVDAYRVKVQFPLDSTVGLTTQNYLPPLYDAPLQQYIDTAYEYGMFTDIINDDIDFDQFVDGQTIRTLLTNLATQFPGLIDSDYIVTIADQGTVTRAQAAKYIVQATQLTHPNSLQTSEQEDVQLVERYFTDTQNHRYGNAAEMLADLDIVSTSREKFMPNNHLRRYEFVIMVINSYLYAKNDTLHDIDTDTFVDMTIDNTQNPYFAYAEKIGLLDYLREVKRGKAYIYPDAFMTKHEVYTLLSALTDAQIMHDKTTADQEIISRGEFAQLLVDTFRLNESYKPTDSSLPKDFTFIKEGGRAVFNKMKDLIAKV